MSSSLKTLNLAFIKALLFISPRRDRKSAFVYALPLIMYFLIPWRTSFSPDIACRLLTVAAKEVRSVSGLSFPVSAISASSALISLILGANTDCLFLVDDNSSFAAINSITRPRTSLLLMPYGLPAPSSNNSFASLLSPTFSWMRWFCSALI